MPPGPLFPQLTADALQPFSWDFAVPAKPDICGIYPTSLQALDEVWWERLGLAPAVPEAPWLHYLSVPLLTRIMPHIGTARAASFLLPLAGHLEKFEITTLNRITAFIGNTAVESGQYRQLEENTNYSTVKGLMATFKTHFPTAEIAQQYVGKPEAIANRAYASRMGNGDEKSGDGYRYRGRGLIQMTGKANYVAFAKFSGVDVVKNPELVAQPDLGVLAAVWFWRQNKLNHWADAGQYRRLGGIINGKTPPFGWKEREHFRIRAREVFLGETGTVKPG